MDMAQAGEPDAKRPKYELRTPQFALKTILPDEYTKKVALVTVHISRLEHKQQISGVMQELSELLPLSGLQHLKRVNQNEIIICEAKTVEDSVAAFLEQAKVTPETVAIICHDLRRAKVPATATRLRWQYEATQRYWPCKFHPDKYLESLYNGSNFSESQKTFHLRIASLVWRITSEVAEHKPLGLVIDPRTSALVAVASSRCTLNANPLMHCPMVLIDYVARTQNGGAWNAQLKDTFADDIAEGDAVTLAGIPKHYYDYIKSQPSYQDLRLGAERLKQVAKQTPPQDGGGAAVALDNLAKYGPYLCTGYDVYLSDEPCLMCAMALVHSRVKRIFFLQKSHGNGALLTRFKLHSVKELNHHYEVFHLSSPTEANET